MKAAARGFSAQSEGSFVVHFYEASLRVLKRKFDGSDIKVSKEVTTCYLDKRMGGYGLLFERVGIWDPLEAWDGPFYEYPPKPILHSQDHQLSCHGDTNEALPEQIVAVEAAFCTS